jgi:hypothetical protein
MFPRTEFSAVIASISLTLLNPASFPEYLGHLRFRYAAGITAQVHRTGSGLSRMIREKHIDVRGVPAIR